MRVVTTFAMQHYESGIAKKMVETFLQYWEGFELHCYINGGMPLDLWEHPLMRGDKPRLFVYDHYAVDRNLQSFVEAYSDVTKKLVWVSGDYNYRYDATRFAHKVYALKHACEGLFKTVEHKDGPEPDCFYEGPIIWLDADVMTHARVTPEALLGMIPGYEDVDIAWLDREGYGPECGFMWFNLPQRGGDIMHSVYEYYETRKIFSLDEWHDSYVFGKVVPKYKSFNLAAGIQSKHPWPMTKLGTFTTHLKGPARKRERADLTAEEAALIPAFVKTDNRYIY